MEWISTKDRLPKKFYAVEVRGYDRPVYLNRYEEWIYPSGMVAGYLYENNEWRHLQEFPK